MGTSILAGSAAIGTEVKNLLTTGFGKTQAQKDADRVTRGNQLYQCALGGDVAAAQEILFGATNTSSDSKVGVQHYQLLLSQLQSAAPQMYAAAVAAGRQPDTTGAGCPGQSELAAPMGLTPTALNLGAVSPAPVSPVFGVTPSPAAAAVAAAGLNKPLNVGTLALIGGGALLFLAAL